MNDPCLTHAEIQQTVSRVLEYLSSKQPDVLSPHLATALIQPMTRMVEGIARVQRERAVAYLYKYALDIWDDLPPYADDHAYGRNYGTSELAEAAFTMLLGTSGPEVTSLNSESFLASMSAAFETAKQKGIKHES